MNDTSIPNKKHSINLQIPAWYDVGMRPQSCLCLISLICLAVVLVSCSQSPENDLLTPWNYTDLKLLDPPDADQPEQDLIAVYTRQDDENLQIRLDLLETNRFDEFDLYLAIDNGPGGSKSLPFSGTAEIEWERLVEIPAHGAIRVKSAEGMLQFGSAIFVIRDPVLQAMLIEIDRQVLMSERGGIKTTGPLSMQIIITSPKIHLQNPKLVEPIIVDKSEPIKLSLSPPTTVNVIFAFWETYPAYTPATALRRWDGAHTGPNGGRHGLYNLLRTAQAAKIPLFLMDMNDPGPLSALDYAGKLDWVKMLQADGLLTLPSVFPNPQNGPFSPDCNVLDQMSIRRSRILEGFDIRSEHFVFLPSETMLDCLDHGVVFTRREDFDDSLQNVLFNLSTIPVLSPESWGEKVIFPVVIYDSKTESAGLPSQAGRYGIDLFWKKYLVFAALQAGSKDNLVTDSYINLGGALPGSAWGDPQSARASFQWINNHPWIKILGPQELLGMKAASRETPPGSNSSVKEIDRSVKYQELVAALKAAPQNSLSDAAWQAYDALFASIFPDNDKLSLLRSIYSNQIWSMLEAAKWAERPVTRKDCSSDPDHDGAPECILTTSEVYTQFEMIDGSLTWLFMFSQDPASMNTRLDKLHEIIGPSSQMISGLSDPEGWDLNAGLNADPSVIPGAFSGPGQGYRFEFIQDGLVFSLDNGQSKTFRFLPGELLIEFNLIGSQPSPTIQLPLLLDPWRRYSPGWRQQYNASQSHNKFGWELFDGPSILVSSSSSLQVGDFQKSQDLFDQPEDPNHDFPPGHYLPFPLALIQIEPEDRLIVSLKYR